MLGRTQIRKINWVLGRQPLDFPSPVSNFCWVKPSLKVCVFPSPLPAGPDSMDRIDDLTDSENESSGGNFLGKLARDGGKRDSREEARPAGLSLKQHCLFVGRCW